MTLPTRELSAEQTAFRSAMAAFPSGVTIVTTSDAGGRWWGFTASSFCSVSLSPPLVLVCLDRNADCHAAFSGASQWAIHLVPPDHIDLARRFATRGADKFAGDWFVADCDGLPILDRRGRDAALHHPRYPSRRRPQHPRRTSPAYTSRGQSGRPLLPPGPAKPARGLVVAFAARHCQLSAHHIRHDASHAETKRPRCDQALCPPINKEPA